MQRICIKGGLLAALALAAAPAAAATPQGFRATLAEAIDRNMTFPPALERSHANGIATVRFSVAPDGSTTAVEIVESSGDSTIDRAARRTVATLDLPAGSPAGPHEAVLQYGTEASFADRSDAPARLAAAESRSRFALRLDERRRLARRGGGAAVSAIE